MERARAARSRSTRRLEFRKCSVWTATANDAPATRETTEWFYAARGPRCDRHHGDRGSRAYRGVIAIGEECFAPDRLRPRGDAGAHQNERSAARRESSVRWKRRREVRSRSIGRRAKRMACAVETVRCPSAGRAEYGHPAARCARSLVDAGRGNATFDSAGRLPPDEDTAA